LKVSRLHVALRLTLLLVLVTACSVVDQWGAGQSGQEALDTSELGGAPNEQDDDIIDDGFAVSPEDCLPGEVYDPDEQLCLIDEQNDGGSDQEGDDWSDPPGQWGDDSFTEDALVIYTVQGNQIIDPQLEPVNDEMRAYQDDSARHQQIWDLFVRLIPFENRTFVSGFIIFTDGPEEIMAAVDPDPQDPALWILSVDIIDAANPQELTASLIHEFGHLLTLNAAQVPPDIDLFLQWDNWEMYEQAEGACSTYFTGEGCSQTDSYINVFFDRFWTEIYSEWYDIDTEQDDDEYYARMDAFYLKYEDRFVTDYAVTNPGEDIAECWMTFVLEDRPNGATIAEQKILFFYGYPELIELRDQILAGSG